MARALVTGASGFVGGHLVEALVRRGDAVRCLVRATSRTELLEPLGVELLQGALDDPTVLGRALEGVEVVYHLAAQTAALRGKVMMDVNAGGSALLSSACARRTTPPVLVHVSSIAAMGPVRRGRVRRESDPAAPVSHYGRSKRAAELAALNWAHRVPTTILRPGIVYGPRNREMLPAFQAIYRARLHVSPGFHPPPLSLIHVDDLVTLMLRSAERGKRCLGPGEGDPAVGCYFACTSEHPTYLQLGRSIATGLGIERVLLLPCAQPLPWLIAASGHGWGWLRGRMDALNLDKMREAVAESWACSPVAARRQLDFVPAHELAVGMRATAQWYRDHGWL